MYEGVPNITRFILGEINEKTHPKVLLVVGINPSVATGDFDDPTIRRVRHVAETHEYDGWVMINPCPVVATKPKELPEKIKAFGPDIDEVYQENVRQVQSLLKQFPSFRIWAAWGGSIDGPCKCVRKQFISFLDFLSRQIEEDRWVQRGKPLKAGHPHHPLYVRDSAGFEPFSISRYLKDLKT